DGPLVPVAASDDTVAINATRDEILTARLSAIFGQGLVLLGAPDVVGVARNFDAGALLVGEIFDDAIELRVGFGAQRRFAGVEVNPLEHQTRRLAQALVPERELDVLIGFIWNRYLRGDVLSAEAQVHQIVLLADRHQNFRVAG